MEINFNTKVALGQTFWFMYGNKPTMLFISEINATITSYTDEEKSWYTQLLIKIMNKTVLTDYKITYRYSFKIDGDYLNHFISQQDLDSMKYSIYKLFNSKEELLASL